MLKKLSAIALCVVMLGAHAATPLKDEIPNAEQGDSAAQNAVGYGYYEGKELPKDPAKAIYWLRKSAEAGNDKGQANLGYMYIIGFGVPKNAKIAISWWEKSAAQGNVLSLVNIGNTYGNGEGLPKDMTKAASYLKRAADKGDTYSMGVMGSLYANGTGVKQDFKQARYWLTKAADAGNDEAKQNLTALAAMEAKPKLSYVDELRAAYGSRITYETAYAKKAVQEFQIDCQRGNRVLPLEHVLLARLKEISRSDKWMVTRVQSRGEDVRISDAMTDNSGKLDMIQVSYELNKWGELRPIGTTTEALLNACFGSYGPLAIERR